MYASLIRFNKIGELLPKSFVLNRRPMVIMAISMSLWGLASLIQIIFLVRYYSDWENYDNVVAALTICDVTYVVDTFMFSTLAYSVLKIGGARFRCKRNSTDGRGARRNS